MAGYLAQPAPLAAEVHSPVKLVTSVADTSMADTATPQLTNFTCVTEDFMKNFGQKVFDTPQMNIFDTDPKTVDLRLKLIEEEVNELEEAMKNKDMVETVDALGDILYVVYGAGGAFGINLDQAFDLVHKSNMTKLCKTEAEAKETVEWYKKNFTPNGKYPYDTPAYRLSPDGQYYVPFNASTGKILKSVNYSPVKFDSILSAEAGTAAADLDTSLTDSSMPEATNFVKVTEEFMKNFGQKIFGKPQMDIFDSDPKTVDLRLKLIREEVQELADAMKAKDMVETVDALGDILYVVYGAGGAFGVNLDQAFDLIHKSNMTKLCKTEEEARETVQWYKKNFTAGGKYPYDTPEYRLSPDGMYYVPFNASTGKILKSVNYSPVKFDSILPGVKLATSQADTTTPQLTNFTCVTEDFMKNFGQKVFDTPQMNIFDTDPKTVDLRLKLIEEEVNELEEAMKNKDMVETVDALGDILYVVYGAGGAFGINLDKAFDLVHKSNMTKLCKTEAEAKETVEWYKKNFTPGGKYPYDTPEYRLSPDGKYYVPFNASTGKILKSVNYSPVKFDSILSAEASTVAADLDISLTDSSMPEATNFLKVTEEFMKNFGQKVFDEPQMDIFDTDPKTVDLRLKLIREEVQELADAMKAKDMVETVDALGDILYVVYGAGGAFGVNLDQAFDLIHKSNMTKLCKTEEEAKQTVEWYKKNFTVGGKYPYDTPEYRLSPDGMYYVPFNASTGKILKSVHYSPVKFDSILPGR